MGNSTVSAPGAKPKVREHRAVNPSGKVKDYPVRRQRLKNVFWILIGVLLLISALALLLYGVFTSWRAVQAHGRSVLLRTAPLPLLGFLIALVMGILILSTTSQHWGDHITLFVNGLDIHKGKQQNFLPWQAITRFDARIKVVKFATSNLDIRSKMLLVGDAGRNYTITDQFENLSDLIGQVRNRLLPILYQSTLQRLGAGEEISFHKHLAAKSEGLVVHGHTYAWEDVQSRIHRRSLRIRQTSDDTNLFRTKTKRVRNLDLLMTLLENPPKSDQSSSPK
ncbi:hypothetical protein KQH56_00220 [bacterium]|nr:hypothetical protein [bacterium]